jgi:hypothetical protein
MANVTILDQMSTGDVIDRSVRLYRRNFTPLVLIVSVPILIGYFASVTFLVGYTQLLGNFENPSENSASGATLMILGMLSYPVWFFVLLFTVSGLSRVVGDHIMLGEPITFRRCFSAAKKRFGDIFLMVVLAIVAFVVLYFVFVFIVIVAALLIGLMAGIVSSAQLSPWVVGTLVTIISLVILAAGIFLLLYILSRIIFMPQIVMIEGYKAGHAIGRAMKLGGGNWSRVGAIILFVYFVSLSLLAAFMVPVSIALYVFDVFSAEFLVSPTWNVISTSFSQISNLLVLPLWVISFTLLYFDNRVKKEGYDLELLAREVSPGFYWQPGQQVPPPSFSSLSSPRTAVQTGPLGLSGYGGLPRESVVTQVANSTPPEPQGIEVTDEPKPSSSSIHEGNGSPPPASTDAPAEIIGDIVNAGSYTPHEGDQIETEKICIKCGATLPPRARFCILCGTLVKQ